MPMATTKIELPLPSEPSLPPASPRSVALTWLSVLALVALVNLATIPILEYLTPNRYERQVRTKWQILETLDASTDSLVVGDSTGNQGVDPAQLGELLGGRWANLSTIADLITLDDAWMIDEYIARTGQAPRRVVVVLTHDLWERDPAPLAVAGIPRPWGFWSRANPPVRFDRDELWLMALGRYVPLYAAEASLRMMLMTPWKVPERWPVIHADGFMPFGESDPPEVHLAAKRHAEYLAEHPFAMSESARAGLVRVLELSQQHGFDVYFAHGSVAESLAEREPYRRRFDAIRAALMELSARYPRLHVLFDEPQAFDERYMVDAEHLVPAGAELYTRAIAERIRALEGDAP